MGNFSERRHNYVAVVATGGPNSDVNPTGFREHVNVAYQGFLHIPGPGPYPIPNSVRSFGVGVRHRGAAVVAQITANGSYTPPRWCHPGLGERMSRYTHNPDPYSEYLD